MDWNGEIKRLEREGDPLGISVKNAHELIAHLYNPKICKETKEDHKRK